MWICFLKFKNKKHFDLYCKIIIANLVFLYKTRKNNHCIQEFKINVIKWKIKIKLKLLFDHSLFCKITISFFCNKKVFSLGSFQLHFQASFSVFKNHKNLILTLVFCYNFKICVPFLEPFSLTICMMIFQTKEKMQCSLNKSSTFRFPQKSHF
jgi:hypothetical protein